MQVADSAGTLLFTYPETGNQAIASVTTLAVHNLVGCEVIVRVVAPPHESSTGYLKFTIETPELEAGFRIRKGGLTAFSKVSVENFHGSVGFKVGSHGWLRIKESGGSLSFDVGPDGKLWSKIGGKAFTESLEVVRVVLSAGLDTSSVVPPGTASFDDFNLPPP